MAESGHYQKLCGEHVAMGGAFPWNIVAARTRRQVSTDTAHSHRRSQSEYLRQLTKSDGRSLRAIAALSARVAQELGEPRKAFTHQALSKWLNGSAYPSREHRELLAAAIFKVPFDEFNRGCDGPGTTASIDSVFRAVSAIVHRGGEEFRYRNLTIKGKIDLQKPAIYSNWFDMFDPKPRSLAHHFTNVCYDAFGWVPDESAMPIVPYPLAMVPVITKSLRLEDRHSVDKRVWFIYLPDGSIDVGFACRDGNCLLLAKAPTHRFKSYPFGRIDLIGYVTGKTVFRLELCPDLLARAS
jgi:transcriptional regulator with XRE-family HTH domain